MNKYLANGLEVKLGWQPLRKRWGVYTRTSAHSPWTYFTFSDTVLLNLAKFKASRNPNDEAMPRSIYGTVCHRFGPLGARPVCFWSPEISSSDYALCDSHGRVHIYAHGGDEPRF
jgi:hypothetical protein